LANSSGQVGLNLMDHVSGAGAIGEFDDWQDRFQLGSRPNGIYIPRFRNVKSNHPAFLRGYGFQGGGSRLPWPTKSGDPGIGVELKKRLTEPGPWVFRLLGFGEMLPREENRITLDPIAKDRWGAPAARIECSWSENERAMRQDMVEASVEILEVAGAKNIRRILVDQPPGFIIHEMGTARMGRDPRTSVLNAWNQAHDVPNLFITDGACMTSSACQNPSLTYMALTARACHYAVEQIRKGAL
jgi:choline dehydrogenase-like flavoprotein